MLRTSRAFFILLAWLLSASSFGQTAEVLPWSDLHPGLYAVGYQVRYVMDETRTWRHTRPFGKPFSADRKGRPVRVSIWYPAAAKAGAKPMRVVDYVNRAAPEDFREANGFLQSRDRRVMAEMAPPRAFESLLNTPMRSYWDCPAARGRFPLVLYSGGVNSYTLSNVFIAELLASHGFVVATVPSIGPSDQEPEQVLSRVEVEDTVRDLEVAWSLVRRLPFCDESRLGVFGHSLGGTVATLFALRNQNVAAIAGLDSTYGFAGSGAGSLSENPSYLPDRMRATLLDLHRAGTQLDLSAVDGFHFANRYCLTVPRALHGDFTSFVVFARAFKLPPPSNPPAGRTIETGYAAFRLTCAILLQFFDSQLKGAPGFQQSLGVLCHSIPGTTLAYKAAAPSPPSRTELVGLLDRNGYDATVALVDRLQAQAPGVAVIDANGLNALGYELSAKGLHQRAIDVLRLVVHVYPRSANACDSLGDAYLAAGDSANARIEFQRALDLAPTDSTLTPEARSSLVQMERDKLAKLGDRPPGVNPLVQAVSSTPASIRSRGVVRHKRR